MRETHDTAKTQRGRHLNDQEALRDFLASRVPLSEHALRIPQAAINAFPHEISCYEDGLSGLWRRGMFVVHFAGAWAHLRGEEDPTGVLMRKYGSQIIW